MSALSARGLRKSYGALEVVSGVDLAVAPDLLLHAVVLVGYAAVGYSLAIYFARKRFSS